LLPRRLVLLAALVATLLGASSAAAAGGSIAFIRQANIWIANPDGTGAKQLTSDGVAGTSEYTTVSAAKGSGAPLLGYLKGGALGTIRADGTAANQLAFPVAEARSGSNADIDYSGQRLTYSWRGSGFYQGVGENIDGSGFFSFGHNAVFTTTWADTNGTVLYSEFYITGGYPPPAPCEPKSYHLTIEVPASATKTYICRPGFDLQYPDVSADFTKVAVSVFPDNDFTPSDSRIGVLPMDATSTVTTYVTPAGMTALKPDWSPDGAMIAFASDNATIWTVPATGGTPVKILDNASEPAWTPYAATADGGGTTGGGTTGGGTTGGGTTGGGTTGGGATGATGGTRQTCPGSVVSHARCLAARAYVKALSLCAARHGKARTACRHKAQVAHRRAVALANCQSIKNTKKRAACIQRARKISS
jgi:hypothetical protein